MAQSTGVWKKGTTLIVGDSIIAGLREAKLSRKRKVKVRFLPGAKTEELVFHLIRYLNKKPDNIIIHIGTNVDLQQRKRHLRGNKEN